MATIPEVLASAIQHHQAGRFKKAEAVFQQTLVLKPASAEVVSNLGTVLQALGKLDEAMEQYRQALVLKPGYAEAYNNLAGALQEDA